MKTNYRILFSVEIYWYQINFILFASLKFFRETENFFSQISFLSKKISSQYGKKIIEIYFETRFWNQAGFFLLEKETFNFLKKSSFFLVGKFSIRVLLQKLLNYFMSWFEFFKKQNLLEAFTVLNRG